MDDKLELKRAISDPLPIGNNNNNNNNNNSNNIEGDSHSSLFLNKHRYNLHIRRYHTKQQAGDVRIQFSSDNKPQSSWWGPDIRSKNKKKKNDDTNNNNKMNDEQGNTIKNESKDNLNSIKLISDEEHDEQLTQVLNAVSNVENDRNVILNDLKEYMKNYEEIRAKLESEYHKEQMKLVQEMEEKARKITEHYDKIKLPIDNRLHEFRSPIADMLEGCYVEVLASTIAIYDKLGNVDIVTETTSSLDKSGEPDFLKFVDRIRDRRRREQLKRTEKIKREAERRIAEKKEEQRQIKLADIAVTSILPIFGQLSLEQAIEALKINNDDINRTLDYIMSKDEYELNVLLAPKQTTKTNNNNNNNNVQNVVSINEYNDDLVEDSGFDETNTGEESMNTPQLIRQKSGLSKLVLIIENVNDNIVEYNIVMDRNRIPCHFKHWQRKKIPLYMLLDQSDFRILSNDEVKQLEIDRNERIVKIWYQLFGDNEFCPIKIVPNIPLNQYTMEWNSSELTLRKVQHRDDGDVMFRAILDKNDGIGFHDKHTPIEVFSDIISPNAHNILHIHLDDTRQDIAIDVINLTGTLKTIYDCKEFKQDISGRQLTYRIVVKDSKVIAILYILGKEVKEAFFVEHTIPSINTLVVLPSQRLARVIHVPYGLIIANDDFNVKDDSDNNNKVKYQSKSLCGRKHPEELSGLIDVEIIMENGKLLNPGDLLSVPVCDIRAASVHHIELYESAKHNAIQLKVDRFNELLCDLEITLKSHKRMNASMSDLSQIRQELLDLKSNEDIKDKIDTSRMNKAFNGLRVLATEKRLAGDK